MPSYLKDLPNDIKLALDNGLITEGHVRRAAFDVLIEILKTHVKRA